MGFDPNASKAGWMDRYNREQFWIFKICSPKRISDGDTTASTKATVLPFLRSICIAFDLFERVILNFEMMAKKKIGCHHHILSHVNSIRIIHNLEMYETYGEDCVRCPVGFSLNASQIGVVREGTTDRLLLIGFLMNFVVRRIFWIRIAEMGATEGQETVYPLSTLLL